MFRIKTPRLVKSIFKKAVWDIPVEDKTLFLTFDDGPTPEVTDFVLDQLNQFDAKATFFCLGKNIDRHPETFKKIIEGSHAIGNHTYNHKNGWKTDNESYLQDIKAFPYETNLFRPPYGRITWSQYALLNTHYSIIMWDVLSADFDTKTSKEQCAKNVIDNAVPGSIIVFHDSLGARERMEYALPRVLEYFAAAGYKFGNLSLQR